MGKLHHSNGALDYFVLHQTEYENAEYWFWSVSLNDGYEQRWYGFQSYLLNAIISVLFKYIFYTTNHFHWPKNYVVYLFKRTMWLPTKCNRISSILQFHLLKLLLAKPEWMEKMWNISFETTLITYYFSPPENSYATTILKGISKMYFRFKFPRFLMLSCVWAIHQQVRINIISARLFLFFFLNSFFSWFVQSDSIEAKEIAIYLLKLSFLFCCVLSCVRFSCSCVSWAVIFFRFVDDCSMRIDMH